MSNLRVVGDASQIGRPAPFFSAPALLICSLNRKQAHARFGWIVHVAALGVIAALGAVALLQ